MEVDQPSAKEQALAAYRDTIRKHTRLETQMRHGEAMHTTSCTFVFSNFLKNFIPASHQSSASTPCFWGWERDSEGPPDERGRILAVAMPCCCKEHGIFTHVVALILAEGCLLFLVVVLLFRHPFSAICCCLMRTCTRMDVCSLPHKRYHTPCCGG